MPDNTVNQSGFQAENFPQIEKLLSLLLRQARQHSLVLMDAEGKIVAWLAGAEEMFGYTAEEMMGEECHRLFTPEDIRLGLSQHEMETARTSGIAEDDRWQQRKDGTRIWVNGLLYRLLNDQGDLAGYAKIMRDMTDLKAHIETLNNRIESQQVEAERKILSVGTLAHELGNTFLALRMSLQLIRKELNSSQDTLQLVYRLEQEMLLTKRIVDDLRDATVAGNGNLQVRLTELVLNESLSQAAGICQPLFSDRRQQFSMLIPPSKVIVDGDPARLHQVFVNLFTNASKYTYEGGQIYVKMTTEGEDVVVRVVDSGVGIEPELLPELFQLFTQGESALHQTAGGMGIGLWLVKDLVQKHGGTVGVRSDGKGKGSEFAVRLPVKRTEPKT